MPGLVGVISKQQPEKCDLDVKSMLASMQHEKFYKSGMYSNSRMSVYIGWIVHPNLFCDCMPVTNHAKDLVLFFAGEVFEDKQKSPSGGDKGGLYNAEPLIRLYEEDGEKFFEKLNGLFCGLLLDLRLGKAFLFNDRYGLHRVFWHEGKKGFYFASEAKALLSVLPETKQFDLKGLGEFLTCGCTIGTHSLYKGINVLPAGALWTLESGEIRKKGSYFDLRKWVCQERLDAKICARQIEDLFFDLTKIYSAGATPVGISLTGGLDTRMVMACLNPSPGSFPCYTFGSIYRDTFDVKVAREVAKACGQPHKVLVLGEEFLRDFSHYLEKAIYISDGYLGLSGAAELYVNSLARNISPVRLTGDFGGELLRSTRAFKWVLPKNGLVNPEILTFLYDAQEEFKNLEAIDTLTFALFRHAQSQAYGRLAIIRSQVVHRTPFFDNALVKLIYKAPVNLLKSDELSISIITRYKPNLLEIPTDRGSLGNGSRVGYLARRFHREVLFKAEYWTGPGMSPLLSSIARFGLNGILERYFIGQHKFQHFRKWTRECLADYITDLLHGGVRDLGEIFNLSQVEGIVCNHLSGKQNYTNEIDNLLTIVLAYRSLITASAPRYQQNDSIPIAFSPN